MEKNDLKTGRTDCHHAFATKVGENGDIWEECSRCGRQTFLEKKEDQKQHTEHTPNIAISGMERCPSCNRYAWNMENEGKREGNYFKREAVCRICGQQATHIVLL